eukprot:5113026-Alexandrium_andersonii.AAC.1
MSASLVGSEMCIRDSSSDAVGVWRLLAHHTAGDALAIGVIIRLAAAVSPGGPAAPGLRAEASLPFHRVAEGSSAMRSQR